MDNGSALAGHKMNIDFGMIPEDPKNGPSGTFLFEMQENRNAILCSSYKICFSLSIMLTLLHNCVNVLTALSN